MGAKLIDDTGGQRLLGADHRQCYFFSSSPCPKFRDVSDVYILKPGIKSRTTIAWRNVYRLHFGRLGQFPRQRVLTATAAHN